MIQPKAITTDGSPERPVRHVLGLSGGKDSAALAIYMRDRVSDMEYFFCDTGAELPETYEYLARLEAALGRKIARLNADRDFDHWLQVFGGALPSPQMRWCTKNLKIKPLEAWIGDDPAVSYVAIRADEHRTGYISHKPNIEAVYPFKDDGINKDDVTRILAEAGVGMPSYYEWRTRSGCYFCFFQRKAEWVGLAERHPQLFEQAVAYEEKAAFGGPEEGQPAYTWSGRESLRELVGRRDEILARHELAQERASQKKRDLPLFEVLGAALDEEDSSDACMVCSL
ncbi:MAG TPA: phosphoadenosine phosphosulfate reductase family protein [Candidatus Limnocylindrales bacterium]|jgi:3'-phosphoadenosine 5'-phosphosulfate sulfotransferase (PAPS reductase)/FAD synthetase|nr:phosphoadenosine phosphosulfate reductase family protein [Candidatus Limnocylindrales bacterium]